MPPCRHRERLLTPVESIFMIEIGSYLLTYNHGNKAALVSTFAKNSETDEYVFFVVDPEHPNYDLVQNVVDWEGYVAEYALNGYPITDDFKDPVTRGHVQYFEKARFDLVDTDDGPRIQMAPLGQLLHESGNPLSAAMTCSGPPAAIIATAR